MVTEVCEGFANRLIADQAREALPELFETIPETVLHGVVAKKAPAAP